MTLELINSTTALRRKFSREFVSKALELALCYGWRPLGTRLEHPRSVLKLNTEWLGTYLTNDGQLVLTEDALNLAQALEHALTDIPDEGEGFDWQLSQWREDELPDWLSPAERMELEEGLMAHAPAGMELPPLKFFAGVEKHYLAEFIRFCRLGSFSIW